MDNDNNYGFNNSDPEKNQNQENTESDNVNNTENSQNSQNSQNSENSENTQGNFDNNNAYSDPTDNGNFYNPNVGYNNNQNGDQQGYNNNYQQNNYNGGNNNDQNNYNSGYNNSYNSNPNNDYNYSQNNGANNAYSNSDGANPNGENAGQNPEGDNSQYSQYGGNVQYKWNYDDYEKALHKNKKAKKRGLKPFIITVSCVFGIAIIGLAAYGITSSLRKGTGAVKNPNGATISIENQPTTSSTTTTTGEKLTNEQVAEKLTPAVVGVEMYNLSSVEPIAEGTGIVMSEDGYIVTNAHVVSEGQKICIVMHDGKKYDTVQLVGKDTKSDLAVLKIDATGLTKATFGDSTQLKVGQEVIAIGNPGGLTFANTVTNGIVSGLNRTVSTSTSGNQMTYIQTNALINPGNSGGPLVNMYGQVVGINTAKVTLSGYEGIGFAIPISSAKPYIDSIIANGYVTGRVKVGVSVYALSDSQAKWYNYPSGLYVESIEKDSDAYKQGLRAKDIITEINGVALANSDSSTVFKTFYTEESKYKAGQTITVKVYKTETNKTVSITFKLEEDKGDTDTSAESSQSGSNQNGNQNGYGSGNGNSNGNQNNNNDASNFWSQFGQ